MKHGVQPNAASMEDQKLRQKTFKVCKTINKKYSINRNAEEEACARELLELGQDNSENLSIVVQDSLVVKNNNLSMISAAKTHSKGNHSEPSKQVYITRNSQKRDQFGSQIDQNQITKRVVMQVPHNNAKQQIPQKKFLIQIPNLDGTVDEDDDVEETRANTTNHQASKQNEAKISISPTTSIPSNNTGQNLSYLETSPTFKFSNSESSLKLQSENASVNSGDMVISARIRNINDNCEAKMESGSDTKGNIGENCIVNFKKSLIKKATANPGLPESIIIKPSNSESAETGISSNTECLNVVSNSNSDCSLTNCVSNANLIKENRLAINTSSSVSSILEEKHSKNSSIPPFDTPKPIVPIATSKPRALSSFSIESLVSKDIIRPNSSGVRYSSRDLGGNPIIETNNISHQPVNLSTKNLSPPKEEVNLQKNDKISPKNLLLAKVASERENDHTSSIQTQIENSKCVLKSEPRGANDQGNDNRLNDGFKGIFGCKLDSRPASSSFTFLPNFNRFETEEKKDKCSVIEGKEPHISFSRKISDLTSSKCKSDNLEATNLPVDKSNEKICLSGELDSESSNKQAKKETFEPTVDNEKDRDKFSPNLKLNSTSILPTKDGRVKESKMVGNPLTMPKEDIKSLEANKLHLDVTENTQAPDPKYICTREETSTSQHTLLSSTKPTKEEIQTNCDDETSDDRSEDIKAQKSTNEDSSMIVKSANEFSSNEEEPKGISGMVSTSELSEKVGLDKEFLKTYPFSKSTNEDSSMCVKSVNELRSNEEEPKGISGKVSTSELSENVDLGKECLKTEIKDNESNDGVGVKEAKGDKFDQSNNSISVPCPFEAKAVPCIELQSKEEKGSNDELRNISPMASENSSRRPKELEEHFTIEKDSCTGNSIVKSSTTPEAISEDKTSTNANTIGMPRCDSSLENTDDEIDIKQNAELSSLHANKISNESTCSVFERVSKIDEHLPVDTIEDQSQTVLDNALVLAESEDIKYSPKCTTEGSDNLTKDPANSEPENTNMIIVQEMKKSEMCDEIISQTGSQSDKATPKEDDSPQQPILGRHIDEETKRKDENREDSKEQLNPQNILVSSDHLVTSLEDSSEPMKRIVLNSSESSSEVLPPEQETFRSVNSDADKSENYITRYEPNERVENSSSDNEKFKATEETKSPNSSKHLDVIEANDSKLNDVDGELSKGDLSTRKILCEGASTENVENLAEKSSTESTTCDTTSTSSSFTISLSRSTVTETNVPLTSSDGIGSEKSEMQPNNPDAGKDENSIKSELVSANSASTSDISMDAENSNDMFIKESESDEAHSDATSNVIEADEKNVAREYECESLSTILPSSHRDIYIPIQEKSDKQDLQTKGPRSPILPNLDSNENNNNVLLDSSESSSPTNSSLLSSSLTISSSSSSNTKISSCIVSQSLQIHNEVMDEKVEKNTTSKVIGTIGELSPNNVPSTENQSSLAPKVRLNYNEKCTNQ